MHPILFKLGPVTVYSYGAALAVAFLLAVGLASHVTERALQGRVPMREGALLDWGCWTMLGGILGGRVLYVLLNWEAYRSQPQETLALWHGGLVWYGGFVGGLLGQALYFKTHGYPFLRSTDQVIPFVALGHAVGRIGCFANGCCYGKPTDAWFGVAFPGHAHRVIPTQLLESASLVVLFLLLRALQPRAMRSRAGALLGCYLIGYAVIRWTLEFWRGDQPVVWAGWTLPQLISLGALLVGLGLVMFTPYHGSPLNINDVKGRK